MRLLAAVTLLTAALTAAPAEAIKVTVIVPLVGCEVTVETNDLYVDVNRRGVRIERTGHNEAGTDC